MIKNHKNHDNQVNQGSDNEESRFVAQGFNISHKK